MGPGSSPWFGGRQTAPLRTSTRPSGNLCASSAKFTPCHRSCHDGKAAMSHRLGGPGDVCVRTGHRAPQGTRVRLRSQPLSSGDGHLSGDLQAPGPAGFPSQKVTFLVIFPPAPGAQGQGFVVVEGKVSRNVHRHPEVTGVRAKLRSRPLCCFVCKRGRPPVRPRPGTGQRGPAVLLALVGSATT